MQATKTIRITVGARSSDLSKAQVKEIEKEIQVHFPEIQFDPNWLITSGDIDKKTSLKNVFQSDFFTKEIEEMQLLDKFRISIHSAKDLPKQVSKGLSIVALTKGIDPRDVLILPERTTVQDLPYNALIGTSSTRREAAITSLRQDLIPTDIRGNIQERLSLLQSGKIHGLIMAEAAIIRLRLTDLNRIFLRIEPEPLQGRLAVIARDDDYEIKRIFSYIDTRVN